MHKDYITTIREATDSLKTQIHWDAIESKPKVAVVLGSGLGLFTDSLAEKKEVSYDHIEHMPASTVKGHAGKWVCGTTKNGHPILAAQGRYHYYEGHPLPIVTLPIRIMKGFGIEHVILTNAAGSVNPAYHPGEFMLIRDQINLMGNSPLIGVNSEELGPRFVDMSEPYVLSVIEKMMSAHVTADREARLHSGVYCAMMGPQYESPSEVKMAGKMGADAVGMSTIPECIVARQAGIKVNGITCITNYGSGIGKTPLSHQEVAEMGKKRAPVFCELVNEMVSLIV